MEGKIIIFSAPSGSGKSTIINYLIEKKLPIKFSISATNRSPRGEEKHGVEYFFLSTEEFKQRIEAGDFLEYEEVYENRFYGTLKSQVEDEIKKGKNMVLDVDVVGGCNIKSYYKDKSLSIFIQPPSIEVLEERLRKRGTDSEETIKSRIEKAAYELEFAEKFDKVIINDNLEKAQEEALKIVTQFIEQK